MERISATAEASWGLNGRSRRGRPRALRAFLPSAFSLQTSASFPAPRRRRRRPLRQRAILQKASAGLELDLAHTLFQSCHQRRILFELRTNLALLTKDLEEHGRAFPLPGAIEMLRLCFKSQSLARRTTGVSSEDTPACTERNWRVDGERAEADADRAVRRNSTPRCVGVRLLERLRRARVGHNGCNVLAINPAALRHRAEASGYLLPRLEYCFQICVRRVTYAPFDPTGVGPSDVGDAVLPHR